MVEPGAASDAAGPVASRTKGAVASLPSLAHELTGRVRRGAGRRDILDCIVTGTAALTRVDRAFLLELPPEAADGDPAARGAAAPRVLAACGPAERPGFDLDLAALDWGAMLPQNEAGGVDAGNAPSSPSVVVHLSTGLDRDGAGVARGVLTLPVGASAGGAQRVLVAVTAGFEILTDAALAGLETWAGIVAVALEGLDLRDNERRTRVEEEELREVALALTASLDLDTVLARVLAAVRRLVGADWASISLVGEHTGFVARHFSTLQSGEPRWYESTSRLRPGGTSRRVLERREPSFVPDLTRDAAANPAMLRLGVRAVATLPMIVGGESVGLLYANYAEPRDFTRHEEVLLSALAVQAAVAIRNAELYSSLRRSEGELRAVLESNDAGYCLTDRAGRVRYANRYFGDLVGTAPPLLIGREVRPLVEAAFGALTADPAAFAARLDVLAGDPEARVVDELELPGPEPRVFYYSSVPARDASGQPIGRVEVYKDITEYRRLERARDDFLAAVAHELRTPLAVIRAHARVLEHVVARAAPGGPAAESVRTIVEQQRAMAALVAQFIDVVRLGRDAPAGEFGVVDLRELLARAVAEARTTIDPARHAIALEPAGGEPLVCRGDAGQLRRVLTNLLDNAIKYSPDGGIISVAGRRAGDEATLTVRDEGLGLTPEQLALLFTRYYRAGARGAPGGRDAGYGGLGLGLYLCKETVSRHGGRIWAESAGPGRGATFTVALPLPRDDLGGGETAR